MENWKKWALGGGALIVFWHLFIAMSPQTKVAGPFLAKPAEPGYTWTDADNADSRFFWQLASVKWVAGIEHPDFKAETTDQVGVWNPLPGYAFVDKAKSLETVWKAGLKHPDYMAWSDDVEGQWIPVTGYKFIYEGDTFVDTIWDPNKRYDDLKVMSMAEIDHYNPFPGYTFVEPGQSLKVVWTPGTVNYENAKLVAGAREGTWEVNTTPSVRYVTRRRGVSGRDVGIFLGGMATGVVLDRIVR